MDYTNSFQQRALSFLNATKNYGDCFENEFKTAVQMMDIQENETIVQLGAGGLNIHLYFSEKENIKYIPLEFSEEFAKLASIELCNIHNIPLETQSVDKILILALLHHFSYKEREILYKECKRILKPSGKLIIADVYTGSKEEFWLDNVVHIFNPCGHQGLFFDEQDNSHIESCGYNVECVKKNYDWVFLSEHHMVDVLKELFYLALNNNKEQLLYYCKTILNHRITSNGKCVFDWSLLYFICSPRTS
jgi:SAM-dependent methyltransferase